MFREDQPLHCSGSFRMLMFSSSKFSRKFFPLETRLIHHVVSSDSP